MTIVQACDLPAGALLGKYVEQGAYTDCFCVEVARKVSHPEYVEAFYTSRLFKVERVLLAGFVSRPSSDLQARELAAGRSSSFAAWSVEARESDQLLLCDFQGRTRSWLMSVPAPAGMPAGTRLYFGSAVVPVVSPRSGKPGMGAAFHALLGFHKLYSRALLRAAVSRMADRASARP